MPVQLQEVPQVALEEGLKVLGIPVGHLLFVDAQVNRTVQAMEDACDLLGGSTTPRWRTTCCATVGRRAG